MRLNLTENDLRLGSLSAPTPTHCWSETSRSSELRNTKTAASHLAADSITVHTRALPIFVWSVIVIPKNGWSTEFELRLGLHGLSGCHLKHGVRNIYNNSQQGSSHE
jgi:hypothetical protein